MRPDDEQRLMWGVQGEEFKSMGIRGQEPVFVVVDDPDGHVVPSDGVEIVGRRVGMIGHFGRTAMGLSAVASEFMNMQRPTRALEQKAKYADEPHPLPYNRKKARKPKQRLKGLRS